MHKLKFFINLLLIATTPSLLVYPQSTLPNSTFYFQKISNEDGQTEHNQAWTYDDIVLLLDQIESGELEGRCNAQEQERIKHFIAFLAKEGALPDDSEESLSLDDDIDELLNDGENLYKSAFSLGTNGDYQYMIVPSILDGHCEIVLCKGWVHKQWKHIKKFAKKHKKALIIGAAVVVAVTVVAVAVVAASSAAAGAGLAGAAETVTNLRRNCASRSCGSCWFFNIF